MSPSPNPDGAAPPSRLAFVDDLRGLAVIFMILWHSLDGWLRRPLRDGAGWDWLHLFGGMAAPLFVLLAGAGVGLRLASDEAKGRPLGPSARSLAARGAMVWVLGYGLRLFMWLVDGGAIAQSRALPIWLPLGGGILLMAYAFHRLAARDAARTVRLRALLPLGASMFALGVYALVRIAPERVPGLLRVDVLQCIGASIVVSAALARASAVRRRPWLLLIGAVVVAGLEPALAPRMPGPLPAPIAGYIARWSTAPGEIPVAMFPLFPWLAYAFAGAALGTALHRASRRGSVAATVAAIAVLGAAVAFVTSEATPHAFRLLQSAPWLTKVVRVSYRVGLALVLLGATTLLLGSLRRSPLRPLGRASLVVYWVHLELVYGAASRPIARRLDYVEWSFGFLVLVLAMYAVARLRLGPLSRIRFDRARGAGPTSPQPGQTP